MGLVSLDIITNQYLTMKKIKFSYLLLFAVLVLSSCSKSDDVDNKVPANAVGVWLGFDGEKTVGVQTYFWINDSYVNWLSGESTENLNEYATYPIAVPYYPLTMDKAYQMVCEINHLDMSYIDKMERKNEYYPGYDEIEFCKKNLSQYKYIAREQSNIYLFNKTSNANY